MRMGGVGIGVRMGGGDGGTVVRWRPGQPCSEDRTGTRVGWCPSLGWEHGEGGDGMGMWWGGGTDAPPQVLQEAPPPPAEKGPAQKWAWLLHKPHPPGNQRAAIGSMSGVGPCSDWLGGSLWVGQASSHAPSRPRPPQSVSSPSTSAAPAKPPRTASAPMPSPARRPA